MSENLAIEIKNLIQNSSAVVIGAGSGLSTSAGYTYSGSRFSQNFGDFEQKYSFHDMYLGGFYPYESLEEYWAYWSRYIYINRYQPIPTDAYKRLFQLVKDKDYFVITTNVDHCFQRSGFDKQRLFYTQGDFGLFQCSTPCHNRTYDNEEIVLKMVKEQKDMKVPSNLIPRCPKCGKTMSMNLRADDTFVEDSGWEKAYNRYSQFLQKVDGSKVVFLELGVGANTPSIIKYPFWKMVYQNKNAYYVCINKGESFAPKEILDRSICLNTDILEFLKSIT